MKLSLNECYVVTYWGEWVGTSMHTEQFYTDKAEAIIVMEQAMNENASLRNSGFKFKVTTLREYMNELREEARWEGERNERDRNAF